MAIKSLCVSPWSPHTHGQSRQLVTNVHQLLSIYNIISNVCTHLGHKFRTAHMFTMQMQSITPTSQSEHTVVRSASKNNHLKLSSEISLISENTHITEHPEFDDKCWARQMRQDRHNAYLHADCGLYGFTKSEQQRIIIIMAVRASCTWCNKSRMIRSDERF